MIEKYKVVMYKYGTFKFVFSVISPPLRWNFIQFKYDKIISIMVNNILNKYQNFFVFNLVNEKKR